MVHKPLSLLSVLMPFVTLIKLIQDKPKPTSKETPEVTESGKKKIEKSEKESKEKAEMKHLKEEKAEKPARVSREDLEDVSASKKAKGPISFFQCVYLDGYNGYGFQFPVTPAYRPGESSGQPSSPGQKQQGQ
ncbi:triadin-like [Vulpes lagopus]|uniref:triadin-like n=1 Tax=Vulpes lagopus TaxID=494514 RepID=UPI001BCA37D8|nr:triadin-like [Vulpes lagopus]